MNKKLHILIAPQAFKGTLSAYEAAQAMAVGVQQVLPNAYTILSPLSDGGDGMLDILLKAKGGSIKTSKATNALGKKVKAKWGVLPQGPTAIIELAQICGLASMPHSQRNPLMTTTFGVGEVIRSALDAGIEDFLIGLGGSATNDGGAGIAQGLGARLMDRRGNDLPFGGGSLAKLEKIDLSGLDHRLKKCRFKVACDVNNPLVGPTGASLIYSPQKGASPKTANKLEAALTHYADILEKMLGRNYHKLPGSGAAGGAATGLAAFLGAELMLGADLLIDMLEVERYLKTADLVITGEGCLDNQSLYNKAPIGIAKRAKKHGLPVIAIVGSIGQGYHKAHEYGIDAIMPLNFTPWPLDAEIRVNNDLLVSLATEEALRCACIKIGS